MHIGADCESTQRRNYRTTLWTPGAEILLLSEPICDGDNRLQIKSHAKQENCTGDEIMWGEGEMIGDGTEGQVRDFIPDRERRKDLLDFYTAESISPKVD